MSKVNLYLDSDSKQKARHRLRRYETAQKKFSRARKYDRGRTKRFDEDSYLLKGSKYKKDFDVVWSVT